VTATPQQESSQVETHSTGRVFVIVAGLLLVAIVVNVGSVVVAQRSAAGIRGHDDGRLSTLVVVEQPTVRIRHGFEAYLHDLARGGTVTVPSGSAVNRLMVENFSMVTVNLGDYDSEVTLERMEALDPGVVILGSGWTSTHSGEVTYRFLMLDASLAPSVTYYFVGKDVYIVDDRLGTP
jgi:hypothetical protein